MHPFGRLVSAAPARPHITIPLNGAAGPGRAFPARPPQPAFRPVIHNRRAWHTIANMLTFTRHARRTVPLVENRPEQTPTGQNDPLFHTRRYK